MLNKFMKGTKYEKISEFINVSNDVIYIVWW